MQLLKNTPTRLYIAPHPLLRSLIAHYTYSCPTTQKDDSGTLTLVPDASGCLVFPLSGKLSCSFWGPTTKTVTVQDSPHNPFYFFVEFLPGGASRFFGGAVGESTDLRLPLKDFCAGFAADCSFLYERPFSLSEWTNTLDRLFLKRLSEPPSFWLPPALQKLLTHSGTICTEELSRAACYSPRHLNRLMHDQLGMSLSSYVRLTRINRAIRRLKVSRMTDLAQELGYYDQSHFIHDFQKVCGVSPLVYLQKMSEFYNEIYKF